MPINQLAIIQYLQKCRESIDLTANKSKQQFYDPLSFLLFRHYLLRPRKKNKSRAQSDIQGLILGSFSVVPCWALFTRAARKTSKRSSHSREITIIRNNTTIFVLELFSSWPGLKIINRPPTVRPFFEHKHMTSWHI